MNTHVLSNAGRRLLSRRDFLQWAGNGLGGIALTSLLAEHRLLGAEPPLRPLIDSAHPCEIGRASWRERV